MREADVYPSGSSIKDFLRMQSKPVTFLIIFAVSILSCAVVYPCCCKKKKPPTKRVSDRDYSGMTDDSKDGTLVASLAIN